MVGAAEPTRKRTRASHRTSLPVKKPKLEDDGANGSDVSDESDTYAVSSTIKPKLDYARPLTGNNAAKTTAKSSATHVRFNSADPPAPAPAPDVAAPEQADSGVGESEEEDVDSDDEAPEDISASTAQQATKAAASGIAHAVREQQLKAKRKRQEQAERANERAAISKRKLQENNNMELRTSRKGQEAASIEDRSDDEDTPELLPEELLAQDFTRKPTPPPRNQNQNVVGPDKMRVVKLDASPLDIQVGPVKVSVLEKVNKVLPPKANPRSRAVREGWLAGRPGKAGMAVERKQFGGGFIKR